ncbi:MAG: helix-turn-helix domain-containing protein [Spirochaetota bacterium]
MIAARLKEIRKDLGYTQKDFSKLISIANTTYCNYENGVSSIPIDLQSKLAEVFDISINWLITGKGSKYLGNEEEKKAAARPSLDALVATKDDLEETKGELEELRKELELRLRSATEEQELRLRSATEELRKELELRLRSATEGRTLSVVEGKADKLELEELRRELEILQRSVYHHHPEEEPLPMPEEPEEEEAAEVPYATDLAAGPLRQLLPHGTYKIPKHMRHLLRGPLYQYFAGKVHGTSMSEMIADGSVVLMRECLMPLEGKVYMFRIDNEFSLKEFGFDKEKDMPYLAWCDGSGERIYPEPEQTCYCVAEFVAVVD